MIRNGTGDTYMTIWSVTEKDGRYSGRGTTSRKNKLDNTYINSQWNLRFVGTAAAKAETLAERDRIVIHSGNLQVENSELPQAQSDGTKRYYLCVTIFDFDLANQATTKSVNTNDVQANNDELPF